MTDPKPTLYHDSVDDLRRELMTSHVHYAKEVDRYRPKALAGSDPMQVTAYMSSLSAGSYCYTLAAILGHAADKFGQEVADELGRLADDILTNGDDDNINADVRPAPVAATAEETR